MAAGIRAKAADAFPAFLWKHGWKKGCSKARIVVADDVFPSERSLFRYVEYMELLGYFGGLQVSTSGRNMHLLEDRGAEEVLEAFLEAHPELRGRVLLDEFGLDTAGADLVYLVFCGNLLDYWARGHGRPFVVEIYPGGGFVFGDEALDRRLRAMLGSPLCRRAVVTQDAVRDYLADRGICPPEKIAEIFGVVTAEEGRRGRRRWYGFGKDRLDIGFAAYRYREDGRDKGWDVFVQCARELARRSGRVAFHVAGGFGPEDADLTGLEGRIFFHGRLGREGFAAFWEDKDIVLSPNRPFELAAGAFDGFPTASVVEAGIRGAAMFVSDPLGMNGGRFTDGEDMVIVGHDPAAIAQSVLGYMEEPWRLRRLARRGRAKVRRLFSRERQVWPRIRVIEDVLEELYG